MNHSKIYRKFGNFWNYQVAEQAYINIKLDYPNEQRYVYSGLHIRTLILYKMTVIFVFSMHVIGVVE